MVSSSFLLLPAILSTVLSIDFATIACERDSTLPYCKGSGERRDSPRRAPLQPLQSVEDLDRHLEEWEETHRGGRRSTLQEQEDASESSRKLRRVIYKKQRIRRERKEEKEKSAIPLLQLDPLWNTLFPALQKDKDPKRYCKRNEYTFQTTCTPGKKLRYDLQVFCEEFADICGVPNTNLYPSRYIKYSPSTPSTASSLREDDGRPKGYGQKQKNGNFGTGNSYTFGVGMIPGLSFSGSQGADIGDGKLPFLNQIGGMMINTGMDVGAAGQRTGKGPARALGALTRGLPSMGMGGMNNINEGDRRMLKETLKSIGLPNLPGLGSLLGGGGSKPLKRRRDFYEPGYGALDKKNPLGFGKVDHDEWNLPAGLGDIEMNRGSGFGFG